MPASSLNLLILAGAIVALTMIARLLPARGTPARPGATMAPSPDAPPTMGRIVRYVGRLGVNAPRPAIVVAADGDVIPGTTLAAPATKMHAHLVVFTPGDGDLGSGTFVELDVPYNADGQAPGSWSWPARTRG